MYLLKLALRPLRLSPWSQLFSASAVGLLLMLVGFLIWLHQSLKPVVSRLQGEQVVTAYLEQTLESKDEEKILSGVSEILSSASNESPAFNSSAIEFKMVRTGDFIKAVESSYPELGHALSELGAEASRIVPRYISVVGVLPDSVVSSIQALPGIQKVETSKDRYHQALGAFSTLKWITRLFVIGVCFSLLIGLINLSKMNSYFHRDALSLLKHWGASGVLLTVPGMISGAAVGFAGGLVAFAGWAVFGHALTRHFRSLSSLFKGLPMAHPHLGLLLLGVGILLGVLAGLVGGFFETQKRAET